MNYLLDPRLDEEELLDIEDTTAKMEELEEFRDGRGFAVKLLHAIYESGSISAMEDALEELLFLWNIPLPSLDPKLKGKV